MEQNNKLIAEFMGLKNIDPNDDTIYQLMVAKKGSGLPHEFPIGNEIIPVKHMEYHTSWDWLMPVIHKCFDVAEDGQMSDIMHHLQVAEMGDTYDTVVEFIKEYNQNN